jgi:hypothetical protein
MGIQKLILKDQHFAALIFPDIKRDRIRFLFAHNTQLKAVAWMMIASTQLPKTLYKSKGIADGNGSFSEMNVPYSKKWTDLKENERKISYHSSGWVKGYGNFNQSINLRNITKRELIKANQYTPPERYETIGENELKSTDIIVPEWDKAIFELDDTKPLMCRVFVEPLRGGRAQIGVLERPGVPNQSALIFPATNLLNSRDNKVVQDLTYHIHFFNEERGNNPDYTFTSFLKMKA